MKWYIKLDGPKLHLTGFAKLDKKLAGRIIDRIESVKADPFLSVKRLTRIILYSLRIGDY